MKPNRRLISSLLLSALLTLAGRQAAQAAEDSRVCGEETARQERLQAIPEHLLHAISLVESGRWDSGVRENLAWPWTVNAEGEGRFLPSKQAAIAEVVKLRARGVRNIDVGCMQINLLAHPDAFTSLDEAFDPRANVAYAGRFLVDLHGQDGNWPQAGAHYHSQTPELAAPYRTHLLAVWDAIRRHGAGSPLQLASLDPAQPQQLPFGLSWSPEEQDAKPTTSPDREQERRAAKQAADAYRLAKLAEYQKKHGQS
jgi:hypothetical protein